MVGCARAYLGCSDSAHSTTSSANACSYSRSLPLIGRVRPRHQPQRLRGCWLLIYFLPVVRGSRVAGVWPSSLCPVVGGS